MKTGEAFVENLFGLINEHRFPGFQPTPALEYGCGVGRLLLPLSKYTNQAVGLDVAPAMLEICRNKIKEHAVENTTVGLSDDTLSTAGGGFDFVNCFLVLQHIPPERGYRIIDRLLHLLVVDGIGSLKFTYAKGGRFFAHEQGKALYYRRDGNQIFDLCTEDQEPPEGTISMFDYDLNQVICAISRISSGHLIMLPTNDDEHLGVLLIFRKTRD